MTVEPIKTVILSSVVLGRCSLVASVYLRGKREPHPYIRKRSAEFPVLMSANMVLLHYVVVAAIRS